MPTRRGTKFYVKRTFAGVGSIYRSLGTESKERARQLEDILKKLHEGGRSDIVRAFGDGELPIQTVAEYYESSRMHELVEKLAEPEAVSLAVACDAALKNKSSDVTDSTHQRYRQGLSHFRRFGGDLTPVKALLVTDCIQEFKAMRLREGAKKETINNDLIAMSVLVTHCMDKRWIEERPTLKQYEHKTRIRYLEPDQVAAYMAVLRRPFRAQMQLLVFTGMRLGESESLRSCDLAFNGTDNRCLIQDSKTDAGVRPIFVPPWAAEAVRDHVQSAGATGTDLIFTIPRRSVQAEHKRACKLAGLHDYTIHDHKHTAAVALARAGMPLNLLQRQLGHKHITMTMRYAQFHPDYGDTAVYFDRVGKRFGVGVLGNASGNTPAEPATAGVAV